jgi:hypothetical protein
MHSIWILPYIHAVPCRAVPCRAVPCHATACHATACHAMREDPAQGCGTVLPHSSTTVYTLFALLENDSILYSRELQMHG